MGTAAQTWSSTAGAAAMVVLMPGSTNTDFPAFFELQDKTKWYDQSASAMTNSPNVATATFGDTVASQFYFFGTNASSPIMRASNTSGIRMINANGNDAIVSHNNSASYNVSTQTINSSTALQPITGAVTPTMDANSIAASNTVNGSLESDCIIFWQQTTGIATVSFGVNLSAAVTRLNVFEEDYEGVNGTLSGSQATTITTTGATATDAVITPGAVATTFVSKLTLILNPGTANNASVALFGATSNTADALVIQPGSGCSTWH